MVILQSTITPPRLPVQHVARTRLLALLEQGLQGPVTLVSAPAGSGKTTLLAEWAATATKPVAWLFCEEAENDPARFLSSLIAALARVDAHLASAAQTDRPWHSHEHEQMLTRLLNDLERLLQQQEPALVPEFYRRAARWYEQHGWTEDACEYALRASDLPHAARLLEELVPSLVEQGKLVRLGRWLDQLPQELISASTYLSFALIWTRPLHTSQPSDPERVIDHLTVLLKTHEKDDPEAQADLQRELALQQATLALSRAAEMTHSLTGPETAWSRFTLWRQRVLLGAAYRLSGDLLASEQTLRQALPADGSSPNLLVVMSLDDLYAEQGRLRELGRLYEDVLRSLPQRRNSPPLLLAQAHWRYGVLLYEWNRLQEAETCCTQQ